MQPRSFGPSLLGVMPLESASTPRAPGIYPPVTLISFRYLEVKVPLKHLAASTRLQALRAQPDACSSKLVAPQRGH